MLCYAKLSGVICSFLCSSLVFLSWLASTPLNGMAAGEADWRTIGPPGAIITTVAVDRLRPATLYAAGKNLFRSSNDGKTWQQVSSTLDSITLLATDPAHQSVLYATQSTVGSTSSNTVYRSADGGQTWTPLSFHPQGAIAAIEVSPANTQTIYVATTTGCYCSPGGQIWRSQDGGMTWHVLLDSIPPASAQTTGDLTTFSLDPQNAANSYYGTTVYHGGYTQKLQDGTPAGNLDGGDGFNSFPTAIAVDPRTPATMYSAWETGQATGSTYAIYLRKSSDGGTHWTTVNRQFGTTPHSTSVAPYVLSLLVDPLESNRLFAAIPTQGVFTSTDGGTTWAALGSTAPVSGVTTLLFSQQRLFAATPTGVWIYDVPPAVAAPFVAYYAGHDGLRVLGHPLAGLQTLNGFSVQYFEKGRIEDQSAVTTNPVFKIQYGLLADELQQAQSTVFVGGDTSTVTYAGLHLLADPAKRLDPPSGFKSGTARLAGGTIFIPYSATLAPAKGHRVPPYFWNYMNRTDLFSAGWLHDIGLPLTEPVKATVTKFGVTRTITVQIFQRTVLTYDPLNPPTFLVERANVGTDYQLTFPAQVG